MKSIVYVTVLIFCVVLTSSTQIDNDVDQFGELSEKDIIRMDLKSGLNGMICPDIQYCCPKHLTTDQIVFATEKVNSLVKCINATVDHFIDIADDDIVRTDFLSVDNIRKYIRPVCEVFQNAFACIRDVVPAVDMCISDREMIFKNKVFSIVPLIHSTMCLNNGSLVADILEHEDGLKCLSVTAELFGKSGASELFFSDTTELFGSENDCREFDTLRQDTNTQLGECSPSVLNLISTMSSHFCEGTKCKRFISDLQCN